MRPKANTPIILKSDTTPSSSLSISGSSIRQANKPKIHTRIVTCPVYAKAFLETLGNTLGQYERGFGEIRKEGLRPND